jgi:hypothetical protein
VKWGAVQFGCAELERCKIQEVADGDDGVGVCRGQCEVKDDDNDNDDDTANVGIDAKDHHVAVFRILPFCGVSTKLFKQGATDDLAMSDASFSSWHSSSSP